MLEPLEMRLRLIRMTRPLQRPRHPKLTRRMIRINRQRLLECLNCLVEILQL